MMAALRFALAALALASCQTTTAPTTDAAKEFARFPVTCPFRADFPGEVEFRDESSKAGLPPGSSRLVIHAKRDFRQFAVVCFCNPTMNFSRVTRADAEAMNDGVLEREKWKRTSVEFREVGSRKEFEFTAAVDLFAGPYLRKGRGHYQGSCANTVEAVGPATEEQALDRFMRSIRDVRDAPVSAAPTPAGPLPSSPTPSATPAPSSTESRLATLKHLLDRKVITQREHDEQRRAILSGL